VAGFQGRLGSRASSRPAPARPPLRDLGVGGFGLDGRPDWLRRGRNEQRDAAFVDGLYSSGLRLTECAGVVLTKLPDDDAARG
jgi:hypothetical protein